MATDSFLPKQQRQRAAEGGIAPATGKRKRYYWTDENGTSHRTAKLGKCDSRETALLKARASQSQKYIKALKNGCTQALVQQIVNVSEESMVRTKKLRFGLSMKKLKRSLQSGKDISLEKKEQEPQAFHRKTIF